MKMSFIKLIAYARAELVAMTALGVESERVDLCTSVIRIFPTCFSSELEQSILCAIRHHTHIKKVQSALTVLSI